MSNLHVSCVYTAGAVLAGRNRKLQLVCFNLANQQNLLRVAVLYGVHISGWLEQLNFRNMTGSSMPSKKFKANAAVSASAHGDICPARDLTSV